MGLVHHSDRGSQYCSSDYRAILAAHNVAVSMSRKGNCWDNAVAESFFSTLKTEATRGVTFATRAAARHVIFEYIATFYNATRKHSFLGFMSPMDYETSENR